MKRGMAAGTGKPSTKTTPAASISLSKDELIDVALRTLLAIFSAAVCIDRLASQLVGALQSHGECLAIVALMLCGYAAVTAQGSRHHKRYVGWIFVALAVGLTTVAGNSDKAILSEISGDRDVASPVEAPKVEGLDAVAVTEQNLYNDSPSLSVATEGAPLHSGERIGDIDSVRATVENLQDCYQCPGTCPAGTKCGECDLNLKERDCHICPGGTASLLGVDICTKCPPGKASASGSAVCDVCPEGTYPLEDGSECAAGQVNTTVEACTKALNEAHQKKEECGDKLFEERAAQGSAPASEGSSSDEAKPTPMSLYDLFYGLPDPTCNPKGACRSHAEFKENICNTDWHRYREGYKISKGTRDCPKCDVERDIFRWYSALGLNASLPEDQLTAQHGHIEPETPTDQWNFCHWKFHDWGGGLEVWPISTPISGYSGVLHQAHGPWAAPDMWGGTDIYAQICTHAAAGSYNWTLAEGLYNKAYDSAIGVLRLTEDGQKHIGEHRRNGWKGEANHKYKEDYQPFEQYKDLSYAEHLNNPVPACKVAIAKEFHGGGSWVIRPAYKHEGRLYQMKIQVKCKERSKITMCEQFPLSYSPDGRRANCRSERKCGGVDYFKLPFGSGRGDTNCNAPFHSHPEESSYPATMNRDGVTELWYKLIGKEYKACGLDNCDDDCCENLCTHSHGQCDTPESKTCGCEGVAHECLYDPLYHITDDTDPQLASALQAACETDCVT